MLIIFCLLFLINSHARQESELRGAVPAGLAAPLYFEGKPGEVAGLVGEYTSALIESLGKKSLISIVTRDRSYEYLQRGQLDLLCYTSPVWGGETQPLKFSKPLFTKREVLIGPTPMPKKITALKDKNIGTILQYIYPKLDPLFKENQLHREDGISEESNLRKLLNNRISYIVTDEIFLDYFKVEHPKVELDRERLHLQDYPITCSFSSNGRIKEKDLNAAIDELKQTGKLENIFRKYGVTLK
jgi:ABC-type amino acid transport/signal transduction systems, periplasmic component/domain